MMTTMLSPSILSFFVARRHIILAAVLMLLVYNLLLMDKISKTTVFSCGGISARNHLAKAVSIYSSRPHDSDEIIIIENSSTVSNMESGLPAEPRLMYIHIGKTGGTTLNSILRSNCEFFREAKIAREKCFQLQDEQVESAISESTLVTMHVQYPRGTQLTKWLDSTNVFFVTVRNPISRTVSAFNMEHPLNAARRVGEKPLDRISTSLRTFYVDCFPTIEDLATTLMRHNDTSTQCFNLARNTLAGRGSPFVASHIQKNYAYYGRKTFLRYPERSVLVVRTESLWDDIVAIDEMVGGTGHFSALGQRRSHGSEAYQVRSRLCTSAQKATLCCYLAEELHYYEMLIRKAANLSPTEKDATLSVLYNDCGVIHSIQTPDGDGKSFFPWIEWARDLC